jgi:competence protein ComEC
MPIALAAFVAGDLVLQQFAALPSAAIILAAALVGAGLALVAIRPRRHPPAIGRGLATVLACMGALLRGFAYTGGSAAARLADALAFGDEGRDVRVQGVVASLPMRFEGGTRFTVEVERVVAAPGADPPFAVPHRIALSWYGAGSPGLPAEQPAALSAALSAVLPAQRWEWTVRLHRPQGTVNPAGFDAEAWLFEQDIRAQGTVRGGARDVPAQLLAPWVWQFNPLVDRARAALRERLQELLQGRRHAGVIVALVMGDQSAIPEADWALFNRTGISHLVSISGLHITMIAALAAVWPASCGVAARACCASLRCRWCGPGPPSPGAWPTACWPGGGCPPSAPCSCSAWWPWGNAGARAWAAPRYWPGRRCWCAYGTLGPCLRRDSGCPSGR